MSTPNIIHHTCKNDSTTIYGYFLKILDIPDKTNGIREFKIKTLNRSTSSSLWFKEEEIRCIAQIKNLYQNTPLKLIGVYKEDECGKYFDAYFCMEYFPNEQTAIDYLQTSQFKGIGTVTAKKIVKEAGYDLIHFALQENAFEILKKVCRAKDETIQNYLKQLRRPVLFNNLKNYLVKHGGTFENAEILFHEFDENALTLLQEHPYRFLGYGVSIWVCDKIAQENNIHYLNEERLRYIIRMILKATDKNGDSYLSLANLCYTFNEYYGKNNYVEPCYIVTSCLEDTVFCHLTYEENEIRIYLKELYKAEKIAASKIANAINMAKTYPIEKIDIKEIEKELHIKYAKRQKESFNLLNKSGIGLLIGGPGMGKTTLEKGFILAFRQMFPHANIGLCAPTAAAAKRMREATGHTAETIHRMLNIRPIGYESYTSKDEYSTLDYDFIIADECSMIDTRLFTMLIRALKPDSLLILVGDDGQLASVGSGNILRDLMKNTNIPTCKLDTYFRQDGKSTIVENGIKIRKGKENLITDNSYQIIRVEDGEEMTEKAMIYMKKYYDTSYPRKCRLFTTPRQKKFLNSTEHLNELLQKEFNHHHISLRRGATTFYVGDPVVFTKNNYTGKAIYLNGDEGIITAIEDVPNKSSTLIIETDSDILEINGSDIYNVEPAYATTVYKAQGAECETAIILLPKAPATLLERSIVLVATTRAKKRNIIITENDALEKAIRTKKMQERNTGFQLRLKEVFFI